MVHRAAIGFLVDLHMLFSCLSHHFSLPHCLHVRKSASHHYMDCRHSESINTANSIALMTASYAIKRRATNYTYKIWWLTYTSTFGVVKIRQTMD